MIMHARESHLPLVGALHNVQQPNGYVYRICGCLEASVSLQLAYVSNLLAVIMSREPIMKTPSVCIVAGSSQIHV